MKIQKYKYAVLQNDLLIFTGPHPLKSPYRIESHRFVIHKF